MQNLICKSCGKPMLSKFQRGGQASGSELTNNIGYWHCEGCDVYIFHAEYVAGKSKLFHKLLHQTVETLKKFNRWKLFTIYQAKPSSHRSKRSHNKSAHALKSFITSLDLVNTTMNTLDRLLITLALSIILRKSSSSIRLNLRASNSSCDSNFS